MRLSAKAEPPGGYIYLVRHGSRRREAYVPETEHRLDGLVLPPGEAPSGWKSASPPVVPRDSAVKSGRERVESIAGALADVLQAAELGKIVQILHSDHAVAKDTASVFESVLGARDCLGAGAAVAKAEWLTPKPSGTTEIPDGEPREGAIVVGHQPELTRLACKLLEGKLLRNRLPGNSLPLGSGEVACIRLRPKPRLLWLLTEKSSDLRLDLRQKIQSKLDVAKFFLSALVVNASILLAAPVTNLWDLNLELPAAALFTVGYGFVLVSLGLTVATLLAFDRLTMPPEFWSEPLPGRGLWNTILRRDAVLESREAPIWSVGRPPSEASVVLFYEMTHVWTSLFTPALVLALVAVQAWLLAVVVHKFALSWRWTSVAVLTATLLGLIVARDYERHAPRLGFED